jgi:hypothetical protein
MQKDPPQPVHIAGTNRGEELVINKGREPGRDKNNPQGYRCARDSTSLNPEDHGPIDPRMPNMPPP